MLFIVLRKIWHNKGLIAALLAGSILAVAMVSSIPMYVSTSLLVLAITNISLIGQNVGDSGWFPILKPHLCWDLAGNQLSGNLCR